jgi:hypothetical protein
MQSLSHMAYPSIGPGHPTADENRELAKFAYRYAVPILIRTRDRWHKVDTHGGTGFLILRDGKKRLVTAQHVVREYRKKYCTDSGTLFHCGDVVLDPDKHIVAEEPSSDLIVLDVEDFNFERDTANVPQAEFFEAKLPGNDVSEGDRVFFGGFPGAYREVRDQGLEVDLGFDGVINVPVTSTTQHEFLLRFDRTDWVSMTDATSRKPADYVEDRRLGGHSGAAV